MSESPIKPCPRCGEQPETRYGAAGFWITGCPHCFDGAPDASPEMHIDGVGKSPGEAEREWNARVEMEEA